LTKWRGIIKKSCLFFQNLNISQQHHKTESHLKRVTIAHIIFIHFWGEIRFDKENTASRGIETYKKSSQVTIGIFFIKITKI
jgi:hypothetical protein